MFIRDLHIELVCEDLVERCLQIKTLVSVMEALTARFGRVHIEQCLGSHVIVRIAKTDEQRETRFSEILAFTRKSEAFKAGVHSCQFLS